MPSFPHLPALGRFASFMPVHSPESGKTDADAPRLHRPPTRWRDPQWAEWSAQKLEARGVLHRLAQWRDRQASTRRGVLNDDLARVRERLATGLSIRPLPTLDRSKWRETLIATPDANDALAWATFCKEQGVGQVVDLGTSDEARRINHCMRSSAQTVLGGGTVAFGPQADRIEGAGFFADQRLPAISGEANARPVRVQVRPHPEGSAFGPDLDVIDHDMSWLRIPVEAGQVIPPRVLLESCAHLQQAGAQARGGHAIFMSPDGDRRALVFAIAWRLQQHLRNEDCWRPRDMSMLLEKLCWDLEEAGGGRLAHAEDLASLLAFASMALRAQASASGGAALKG